LLGLPMTEGLNNATSMAAQNPYQVHHNHSSLPFLLSGGAHSSSLAQTLGLGQNQGSNFLSGFQSSNPAEKLSALAIANQLAFLHNRPAAPAPAPPANGGTQNDLSSFAAGFAAATALQQQQLRQVLGALGVGSGTASK
jgi:hypothetical protein